MEEYEREVELIDYIEVLLKWKRLIIGGAVLCALVVGMLVWSSPRVYEAKALIVVSPELAAARRGDRAVSSLAVPTAEISEIVVPGLAASTYEALATGDELLETLRDSLLARPLPVGVAELISELGVEGMQRELVAAELVKETEKADSPLLAFRVTSAVQDVPVMTVNLWTELFVERHRGLSSNVAGEYYQWVQAQYDTSKSRQERTERELRRVGSAYGELSALQEQIKSRGSRRARALRLLQKLETDLEAKEYEHGYVRKELGQISAGGVWLGHLSAAERGALSAAGSSVLRKGLLEVLRDLDHSIEDSIAVQQRRAAMGRKIAANRDKLLLEFDRQTGIGRARRRLANVDSVLKRYRREAAGLDHVVKSLGLRLEVYGRNREQEAPVRVRAKAIVDEELWEGAASRGRVDEGIQKKLGEYRLVSEEVNPAYESLSQEMRQLQVAYDQSVARAAFLADEIPSMDQELGTLQEELTLLREGEAQLQSRQDRERWNLETDLRLESEAVLRMLERTRRNVEAHEKQYRQFSGTGQQLAREIAYLRGQLHYQVSETERWGSELRARSRGADSLGTVRARLARDAEVARSTSERLARLVEEARIAREQGAGDIQIVSKATVARSVPRHTVRRTGVAGVAGLMASLMLAFLLEHVSRAREEGTAHPPGMPVATE